MVLTSVFDRHIPIRIPSTESRWAVQVTLALFVALSMIIWAGIQGHKVWIAYALLAPGFTVIARPAWVYVSIVVASLMSRSLINTTSKDLVIISRSVFIAPLGDIECYHETYDREAIRFENKRNGKQFIIFRDWTEPAAFDRLTVSCRSPIPAV